MATGETTIALGFFTGGVLGFIKFAQTTEERYLLVIRMTGFICATCGQHHDELPMCFGPSAPAFWLSLPEGERNARGALNSDQCVVDGEHFFVLGRILLPVIDGPGPFIWLAWVSLSEKNFLRSCELWNSAGRESETPYFGWLQSALPYEPTTLSLGTSVQTMPVGERPTIILEPTDHPLALEQKHGITLARVQQIAEAALHG
ncbi:DUF2199 domain-containing protein [Comamonadaceae bacterium G21597-S1]|nr:DUF2199 domain-containing protein [Comamonadaceae bacterium G21597-S1]